MMCFLDEDLGFSGRCAPNAEYWVGAWARCSPRRRTLSTDMQFSICEKSQQTRNINQSIIVFPGNFAGPQLRETEQELARFRANQNGIHQT